jgi:hypothetical protein
MERDAYIIIKNPSWRSYCIRIAWKVSEKASILYLKLWSTHLSPSCFMSLASTLVCSQHSLPLQYGGTAKSLLLLPPHTCCIGATLTKIVGGSEGLDSFLPEQRKEEKKRCGVSIGWSTWMDSHSDASSLKSPEIETCIVSIYSGSERPSRTKSP